MTRSSSKTHRVRFANIQHTGHAVALDVVCTRHYACRRVGMQQSHLIISRRQSQRQPAKKLFIMHVRSMFLLRAVYECTTPSSHAFKHLGIPTMTIEKIVATHQHHLGSDRQNTTDVNLFRECAVMRTRSWSPGLDVLSASHDIEGIYGTIKSTTLFCPACTLIHPPSSTTMIFPSMQTLRH